MNNKIRVLALGDNNNDLTFYLENDSTGYNMRYMMWKFAHPHTKAGIIRFVYLKDIPNDDIKAQKAFNVVDGKAKYMPWQEAFDFLYDFYGKDCDSL